VREGAWVLGLTGILGLTLVRGGVFSCPAELFPILSCFTAAPHPPGQYPFVRVSLWTRPFPSYASYTVHILHFTKPCDCFCSYVCKPD